MKQLSPSILNEALLLPVYIGLTNSLNRLKYFIYLLMRENCSDDIKLLLASYDDPHLVHRTTILANRIYFNSEIGWFVLILGYLPDENSWLLGPQSLEFPSVLEQVSQ
jgi:hypothetical protein